MTMMSMFEKRVEAAARSLYENMKRTTPGGRNYPSWDSESRFADVWRGDARAALEAADAVCCAHPKCPGGSLCCCQSDAVVTEEMIADTLCSYQRHTGDRECEYDHETARAILALFRGGEVSVDV